MATQDSRRPRLSGLHCLVVDDISLNRLIAQQMLISEGAHVTLAADGQQALQHLQAEQKGFDIVLMDVQMPVMDGLAATRAMRMTPGLRDLPVIAWSAGLFAEQHVEARDAGCNGFLSKPVDLDELVATVARCAVPYADFR